MCKIHGVKAVLYIGFSIVCFLDETPCILAGIFMLFTSILNIFAQINTTTDAADGTSDLGNNSEVRSTFGTF
jgi:hypothetical protein